jgi:YhgE/Pip-like protein
MALFKHKLVLLSPIIVLAVVVLFGLTLVPSIKLTPNDLPIALVNEDEGVDIPRAGKMNMGDKMADMIKEKSANESPVKWIEVNSEEEAKRGLDDQAYYAALVIPKDFSAKQASLQTAAPSSPELHLFINQGMNTMAANMAGQILNGMVDGVNQQVRSQLLAGYEKQGGTLTTAQASILVSPVTKTVTNVNEIGTNSMNGNAPVSLFQPLWMASIAGSVLVFIIGNKLPADGRKGAIAVRLNQALAGGVLAFTAGFGLTWTADLLGVDIPQFIDIALFLSLAFFAFFLLISAVLSWLGMRGIPLFILILFFGAPLLAMAPEFMSAFYRDWVYSWLPMRFLVEGLRELMFFNTGLSWNDEAAALAGIGAVSFVILTASALKRNKQKGDGANAKA